MRDPMTVMGLGPHPFTTPYEAWDEDNLPALFCGARTSTGSPCGFPEWMHPANPDPIRPPETDEEPWDYARLVGDALSIVESHATRRRELRRRSGTWAALALLSLTFGVLYLATRSAS